MSKKTPWTTGATKRSPRRGVDEPEEGRSRWQAHYEAEGVASAREPRQAEPTPLELDLWGRVREVERKFREARAQADMEAAGKLHRELRALRAEIERHRREQMLEDVKVNFSALLGAAPHSSESDP